MSVLHDFRFPVSDRLAKIRNLLPSSILRHGCVKVSSETLIALGGPSKVIKSYMVHWSIDFDQKSRDTL